MKTKLKLSWLIAVGLLAPLALPEGGAAEALVEITEWLGDSHIAEFAVAANAFTIVP